MIDKAKRIRILILDVDGVMTNGGIIYSNQGEEFKFFNVRDGLGIRMLIQEGIKVAIISGRKSRAVDSRAEDLGINEVYQGVRDKLAVFEEILKKNKIKSDQAGFIGDDLVDIPLLSRVGFAVGVADAVEEVKERVDYVTRNPGGRGAIREVCDFILKSQGKWKKWEKLFLIQK
ncbi:MAG: 3-deoxy-manno-octulosonate-8-phosphatase KdsC [Deltaproteobacteria bacterium]|nr:3-deoxy-manno-octulosonate-8-phosphatase KdsC [Deltaproteobacteria bacterium]